MYCRVAVPSPTLALVERHPVIHGKIEWEALTCILRRHAGAEGYRGMTMNSAVRCRGISCFRKILAAVRNGEEM